jgi:pantothenate synthetase
VAVRDADTLVPLRTISGPARVLAAVRIGSIRLIDNRPV